MGKCKLYIQAGEHSDYIGEYASREAAERQYDIIKAMFKLRYGPFVIMQPVYVEQGKGRNK